jgi:hypothetical protein
VTAPGRRRQRDGKPGITTRVTTGEPGGGARRRIIGRGARAAERKRSRPETALARVIATAGILGIGVAIAAIMASQHSQGWLIGLIVAAVSLVLGSASRRL